MRSINIDDGIDFSHVMGANRSFLFKQNKQAIKLLVMNLFGVLCPFYHISANHVCDHSEVFEKDTSAGISRIFGPNYPGN